MLLRLEAFGRTLTVAYGHTEDDTDDAPEDTGDTCPTHISVGFVQPIHLSSALDVDDDDDD